ncbi:protein FAR-RED IMPAIRED RESPONSE 1-like [Arachis duranensis]|uniref:Protein FAR1-RELATED SEQUENCE n=1 Tax=Arachis duranensis TaxID=130453 RepID=A0A9C6TVV8_ARADU|nr:protein FAR-RED IMPAIRED RESPONSE 1-like [Arachis duranensis]
MIKKYGLEENEWVLSEYEKRKSWASAYLRDKFCAGFRTTSRCEAINNFIKRFIGIRQSLLELVQNLEHALRDYRNNELVSQFKTLYGEPVLTTGLEALELSAANFYTREILGEVKKEIQGVVALDVINEENISTTVVLKVKECDRRQHIYNVLYDRNTEHMECECSRWSSEGIPCRHMFCAMKRVGLQKLPDSLLLRRWSKDAKKYLDESSAGGTTQDREREFLMRYGALSVAATWMVFLGAQDGPSFHDTMNEVYRWTQTLEQKSDLKRQTTNSTTPNFVGDPSVVKTKGAPKGKKERGKRRCTKCNSAGHVKNKCPVRNDGDDLGDKTGNGAQASFGIKEEFPKDPMASQETLAVPNTEVNVPVQQESGLDDSGLINGHENPIPPYGSCTTRILFEVQWDVTRTLFEVQWDAVASKAKARATKAEEPKVNAESSSESASVASGTGKGKSSSEKDGDARQDSRYVPVKLAPSGFVLLKDLRPSEPKVNVTNIPK